jgi:hypothetical protein
MSLEALIDILNNAENPEEALKEHIAKQQNNACKLSKNICTTNSLQNNAVTPVTLGKIQVLPKNSIRNKAVTPAAPVTPKKTISVKDTAITPKQEKTIRTWLTHIGEPEEDHYIVLNKCRRNPEALAYYLERATEYACEQRRQKVLKMLAENPDRQRAYITDTETDQDNVILTVAIRGMAAFEMLIPKIKYDPFLLFEMIGKELLQ